MTSLRRLMRLPRFPIGTYILVLSLLLVFAYIVSGPAYQFFVKLGTSLGSLYAPMDREREGEILKTIEEKKR